MTRWEAARWARAAYQIGFRSPTASRLANGHRPLSTRHCLLTLSTVRTLSTYSSSPQGAGWLLWLRAIPHQVNSLFQARHECLRLPSPFAGPWRRSSQKSVAVCRREATSLHTTVLLRSIARPSFQSLLTSLLFYLVFINFLLLFLPPPFYLPYFLFCLLPFLPPPLPLSPPSNCSSMVFSPPFFPIFLPLPRSDHTLATLQQKADLGRPDFKGKGEKKFWWDMEPTTGRPWARACHRKKE